MKIGLILAVFTLQATLQQAPKTEASLTAIWALSKAKTMEFQMTEWVDDALSPTPKLSKSLVVNVKVQRPNSLRYEIIEKIEHRQELEGGGIHIQKSMVADIFSTDGRGRCLYYKDKNKYAIYPSSTPLQNTFKGIEKEDLLMRSPLFFSENPLKEFKMHYDGIVAIEGIKGEAYSGSTQEKEKSALFQFILDSQTRLPLLMRGFALSPKGDKKIERERIYFTNWKLNKPIDASLFESKPPVGATLLTPDNRSKTPQIKPLEPRP